MRLIVSGVDDYKNRNFLFRKLDFLTKRLDRIQLLVTDEPGVADLAAQWADCGNAEFKIYTLDDVRKEDRKEPEKIKRYLRQLEMIKKAEAAVVFTYKNTFDALGCHMVIHNRFAGNKVKKVELPW